MSGSMDDVDAERFQRIKFQYAKRLVTESFCWFDDVERKGLNDEQLAIVEKERIKRLIASRRQREAKLAGDFASDGIYNMDDEEMLSMLQSQQDSRRRIEALCERRRKANSTQLVVEDLIQELQTYLTRCSVYVGLVRPGRNSASVLSHSREAQITTTIRREGERESWGDNSTLQPNNRDPAEVAEAANGGHWYEGTSREGFSPPTSDVVFKCVDAVTAVVVGASMEKIRRDAGDKRMAVGSSIRNSKIGETQGTTTSDPVPVSNGRRTDTPHRTGDSIKDELSERPRSNSDGTANASGRSSSKIGPDGYRPRSLEGEDRITQNPNLGTGVCRGSGITPNAAVYPQLCVPLMGTRDNECIGVLGAHGFKTSNVIKSNEWSQWYAKRVNAIDKAESRLVKRLKLIRPRGIPKIGNLVIVPKGTAAKAVYGSVERITQKRDIPMYSVRWEDGLFQVGLSKKNMHQVVAQDDASAGRNISLTEDIISHLTWIGKTVGPLLDAARKNENLIALEKVSLAMDARYRDVVESALVALVECLPSIAAAEVWQLNSNQTIRCTYALVAGGEFCSPNKVVKGLLHEEDLAEFCEAIQGKPVENESPQSNETPKENSDDDKPVDICYRERQIIRPKRTPGVLAAPFYDFSFKVGRSYFGADRLARGFTLVLRIDGQGTVERLRVAKRNDTTTAGTTHQRGRKNATDPEIMQHQMSEVSIEDGAFTLRVAKELGDALARLRDREHRAAPSALSLKRLEIVCSEKGVSSGEDFREAVLSEITTVLSGCRAYIGELQPGGEKIVYRSCTANSCMRERVLRRGEGISFACLDDPEGQVRLIRHHGPVAPKTSEPPRQTSLGCEVGMTKPPTISTSDSVEVWYASSWLAATVLRDRGHECYDVRYDDFGETEAGVPRWRLRKMVRFEHLDVKTSWDDTEEGDGRDRQEWKGKSAFDDEKGKGGKSYDSWPWPFVCVPLRSASNRVGVLGIDGWARVHLERPEDTLPEKSAVSFLRQAGAFLAHAMYMERRSKCLLALESMLRSKEATEESAFEAMTVFIQEVITFRRRVDVFETRSEEPGAVYLRGTWECFPSETGASCNEASHREPFARVFEKSKAPKVEELCITPMQLEQLQQLEEDVLSSTASTASKQHQSLASEKITPYHREIYTIIRDGPISMVGLRATALATRPGEIVGCLKRLSVRTNGTRPSANGWYLVRVFRALPEAPQQGHNKGVRSKSEMASSTALTSEEGDISLLSEMCQRLEVSLMAIATREKKALVRKKALDRVLACCRGFSLGYPVKTSLAIRHDETECGQDPVASNWMRVVTNSTPRYSEVTTPLKSVVLGTSRSGRGEMFCLPLLPPLVAETPDGRRGTLVALKDGKLGVLVHQGDRRVAVVALPGGKQQTLPETAIVPGQPIFLQSGQKGVLVEVPTGAYAAVVSTGGKSTAFNQSTREQRSNLPSSVLKGDARPEALQAEKEQEWVVSGLDLAQQVIASIQWALPQVDAYLGILSPFASSLEFVTATSRSDARGHRLCRHSKPNGGPNLCAIESDSIEEYEQTPSWNVIDTCKMAVVAGRFSAESSRMHFFSDPNNQGWPWIGTPVRPGLRSQAIRGILCVDRFEEPWAEEKNVRFHPENDVKAFLEACACSLGHALDREAKARALRKLQSVCLAVNGTFGTAVLPEDVGEDGQVSSCTSLRIGKSEKEGETRVISSVMGIYAASTAALSEGLVHCGRFEVWEAKQPRDEHGRFFPDPHRAGQPPPFQPEDGDTRERLKLQITHCTGLAKSGRFSLPDPFCVIGWTGEKGKFMRTPTVHSTIHPIWRGCYFELPLGSPVEPCREHFSGVEDGSDCYAQCNSETGDSTEGLGCRPADGKQRRKKGIELTVEIWDEHAGVTGGFLGQVKIGDEDLLEIASGGQNMELPLNARSDGSLTDKQESFVQGSVGLRLFPVTEDALSMLQMYIDTTKLFLEVTIEECLRLRCGNEARLSAAVKLDGQDIATTPAMPDGSNPVWMELVHVHFDRERLSFPPKGLPEMPPTTSTSITDFSITIWDRGQSKDHSQHEQCEFVGRISLSIHQLVAFADGEPFNGGKRAAKTKRCELPLDGPNGNQAEGVLVFSVRETSPSDWRTAAARSVSLRKSFADEGSSAESFPLSVFDRRVRLTLLRATGLTQADSTDALDPMCILSKRGGEVGRTTTVYGSLNPVWGRNASQQGESFLLTIPHPREACSGEGGVTIEVYDEDFGNPSDFLGQVAISGNDLLRFHSRGTFKGTDAQSVRAVLQKKPKVPPSEQWLVEGVLFYRLEGVDPGEEKPTDFVINGVSHLTESSRYRMLEIRIMKVQGLARSDTHDLSDPYVVLLSNKKKELGRTRTVQSSLEPVWTNPEERFVVAVGLEEAANNDLALEVWDEGILGKGDFLGQVSFPKVELLTMSLPTGPLDCELGGNVDENDEFNKLVQGTLTISIREAYGDMPDEPLDGVNVREALLTVLSAKGLAKADLCGNSDPFAVVLLNRQEIGRTRTMFKTNNPVWSNPPETFPVRVRGNKTRCSIAIQLWDEDPGMQGNFLGQVALGWDDLDLHPCDSGRDLDLGLKSRDGGRARDEQPVQGTIQLRLESLLVFEAQADDRAARSYIVTVDRGWDLTKTRRFGKSGLFVSVKVNGDEAEKGRTRVISGTSHPIWKDPLDVFILTAVEEIIFEVWDANVPGRGGFLGEARLIKRDLVDGVPVDGVHEFTVALGPRRSASDTFNQIGQGFLRLKCQDWMSPDRLLSEGLGERVNLTVLSASDLPRHDFGLYSAVARVCWNGLEIGRTRAVTKSNSPFWDEAFQVSVPVTLGNPQVQVTIEVLDAGADESVTGPEPTSGINSTVIGSAMLDDRDLQLPGTSPPCKVLELPLELVSLASAASSSDFKNARDKISPLPVMFIFLERSPISDHVKGPAVGVAHSSGKTTSRTDDLGGHPPWTTKDSPRYNAQQKMMQLKLLRAEGLSRAANAMGVVVIVRACGRYAGTTRLSTVGRTMSPEWIDEQFVLPAEMCRELWFEVWGRKMGNQDTFLGRMLPLQDQRFVGGRLLLELLPWHEFDYVGEMAKSNANRGLQVQIQVVGATNLAIPTASIFATFSLRKTEVSRTSIVTPLTRPTPGTFSKKAVAGIRSDPAEEKDACSKPEVCLGIGKCSHVWPARKDSICVVPLPEECWERREVEINIDVWEKGGQNKDRGNHLGQVTLSGDFVPHVVHGAVFSRHLRPPRARGGIGNLTARGSLRLRLWLRRGGERLASEFVNNSVIVETLAVKGLSHTEDVRRRAFCVVREDRIVVGRTHPSIIVASKPNNPAKLTSYLTKPKTSLTGRASWEGSSSLFKVAQSPQTGCLPLEFTVEVWEIEDMANGTENSSEPSPTIIGVVKIGADELLYSLKGRLSLPIQSIPGPNGETARMSSRALLDHEGRPEAEDSEIFGSPEIVLRVTHQIGLRWGSRALAVAKAARHSIMPRSVALQKEDDRTPTSVNVVYRADGEESVRTYCTPVTPDGSIPLKSYDDVIELTFASLPARCPNAAGIVVAPISDIGVRMGNAWIGPQVYARHTFVAYRTDHATSGISRDIHNEMDSGVGDESPQEDELFMRMVAAETEGILRNFRAREMRAKQRQLALSRVRNVCDNWSCARFDVDEASQAEKGSYKGKHENPECTRRYNALYQGFLKALETALPGVSIYIGILVNGGQTIRYVACTRTSNMAGKELVRGEGVSFSCVGPRFSSCVVHPSPKADGSIEGRRGRRQAHQIDLSMPRTVQMIDGLDEQVGHTGASPTKSDLTKSAEQSSGLSPEQGIVCAQSTFRGMLSRNTLRRRQESSRLTDGTKSDVGSTVLNPNERMVKGRAAMSPSPSIPKVFDFDGRVGWPFVCIPIVGFLGTSSIGVIGMDTFEEMGSGRATLLQPETDLVQMVGEAARLLGKAISSDRRERALNSVEQSCISYKSTMMDVLLAMARATECALIPWKGAEVWNVDPSNETFSVLTRHESALQHDPERVCIGRVTFRWLKVEVISAELRASMMEENRGSFMPPGTEVRLVAENAIYTSPYCVKQQLVGGSCSPVTHDRERYLRINQGVTHLHAEVIAKSQDIVSTHGKPVAGKEHEERGRILAVTSVDVNAIRDGLNHLELFRPGQSGDATGNSSPYENDGDAQNGHLALRLSWLASREEQMDLVIHDITGVEETDRSRHSKPFCVVKREGVELGRTQTLSNAYELDWGHENFQPNLSPGKITKTSAFIIEVWDKNVRGAQAGFLGQVVLEPNELGAALPSVRKLPLTRKPAAELNLSAQKRVQGMLEFSVDIIEAPYGVSMETGNVDHGNDLSWQFRNCSTKTLNREIMKNGTEVNPSMTVPLGIRPYGDKDDEHWEGLMWDYGKTDHVGTSDTLGGGSSINVDGSRSKTKPASKHEETSLDHYDDLSIRLKGFEVLKEVAITEQSRFYGVVRLGLREVGRTSLLKSGSQLILEEPGQTFHVAIEEACLLEKSSTTSDFNQSKVERVANAVSNAQPGAGTKASKISSGILRSDLVDTVELEDEAIHDSITSSVDLSCTFDKHEQEPSFPPLKIELWNQNDNHEGYQQLLGTAIVPIWGTQYPVGDLRLSLKDSVPLNKTSGPSLSDKGFIENVGRESKNELSGVIETFPVREIDNEDTATTAQGGNLIKGFCGLRPEEQRTHCKHGSDCRVIGFVHLWLGKASNTGTISQHLGHRRVIFKVHAVSGLPEKVKQYERCPKCFVFWNGMEAGSTSISDDPSWGNKTEAFPLDLPRDRSSCELYVNVWDMEHTGRKGQGLARLDNSSSLEFRDYRHSQSTLSARVVPKRKARPNQSNDWECRFNEEVLVVTGSFTRNLLGRATVPTAVLLHPLSGECQITLQLRPLNDGSTSRGDQPKSGNCKDKKYSKNGNCEDKKYSKNGHGLKNLGERKASSCSGANISRGHDRVGKRSPPRTQAIHGRQFPGHMEQSDDRSHVTQNNITVSGTLTVSLQIREDWDANGDRSAKTYLDGIRQPQNELSCEDREDMEAAKLGHGREGTHESRMFSRVQSLRDSHGEYGAREDSVVTGVKAVGLSGIAKEARAIIPEVHMGQVLSLASRRAGHTILQADGVAGIEHDRLVVFLRPVREDADEDENDSTTSHKEVNMEFDERPRHALVVSCAPGQLSEEDIAIATELVRAAEKAVNRIRRQTERLQLIEHCADKMENLCLQYMQHHEGLCAEVVSALTPSCSGVGAEIDCHPRNMPIIVALLNPGGHHFRVAASSTEWGIGHESLPTRWWEGQLSMTSSLVRRTVKKGDIFLVIEDAVYVANVSWSGVWQESMHYIEASSYPFLKTSVDMLRDSIGPAITSAFIIAPLWIPDTGGIGLVFFTDVPFARDLKANHDHKSKTHKPERFVVGYGIVDLARRTGLALGIAVDRLRRCSMIGTLKAGSEESIDKRRVFDYKRFIRGKADSLAKAQSNQQLLYAEEASTRKRGGHDRIKPMTTTNKLISMPLYKEACTVYSAVIAAATQVLPWIQAADVWHISYIPDSETVTISDSPISVNLSFGTNGPSAATATSLAKTILAPDSAAFDMNARFDERVIAKTTSETPTIVLRSLRAPGREEAERGARWSRESKHLSGGGSEGNGSWTNQNLRLLADEWTLCTGRSKPPGVLEMISLSHEALLHGKTEHDSISAAAVPRPFMVHSGHIIIPFVNGRVMNQKDEVLGHGVVLAVAHGVDWRKWESHLIDIAKVASRWFEYL